MFGPVGCGFCKSRTMVFGVAPSMRVNFREGMRRLGLLLGLLGACAGAVVAWDGTRTAWTAYKTHGRFESVMASPTMQNVAKAARDDANSQVVSGGATTKVPKLSTFGDAPLSPSAHASDPWEQAARDYNKQRILVKIDGIDQVTVDQAGLITSIYLSTGESVERTDAPHIWAFLPLLFYPALGFLIPWGAVRVITWVGGGFFESRS